MLSYLSSLFSSANYIPHGICLLWQPELMALHAGSDAAIAIAYYSIPFAIIYFVWKRTDLVFPSIFMLSGAFILACGTTHVMSIVTLWQPHYQLEGIVKLVTALVSVASAFAIWRIMPLALALPGTAQLEQANRSLAHEIAEREQREADLVASEARLRMAQTRTGVGIWDRDLRSNAVSWTPELEEIYGLEAESMKAYSDFRDRVHPDDIENLEACRDAAIQKRERFLHEFRIIRPSGEVRWVLTTGSAVYDQITREPIRLLGNNVDITERKRSEEHQKTLMAELDHRVKNVLARVSMLAASTRKESTTIDKYVSSLQGRIQSMAVAHGLLSQSGWQNVGLGVLVGKQLAPYASGSNVTIKGEDIALSAAEIQAVAMVLHELVTNAAKYGSLSVPDGRVCITWERVNLGAGAKLLFEWRELGGPPVQTEIPSGYGTSLIGNLIPHELGEG